MDKKILIVDDDEFLLEMYALKFKDSGFDVDSAKGGEETLAKLREGARPDIMLLDVVMPVMDGFEVLRIAKKENLIPKTIVVILTNLGQKEDVDKGMALGADDYIVKAHFTPSEVVRRAVGLIESKSK
uniref:Two-component response regulator n=1 Tax=Candidatus Giovannonibacteria bacterium GW2011_GWF2_42_19 TaxID=1618659 RepID=A0A0G0ZFQ2_9BACT|nr:MAG: Two-component response regulator [Candidatus Giovannonibacteria bacterium GW2011_GWF2_42_19]